MKTLEVHLADDLFAAVEALAAERRESPDECMAAALRMYLRRRAASLRAPRPSPEETRAYFERIAVEGDRELERAVLRQGERTLGSVPS